MSRKAVIRSTVILSLSWVVLIISLTSITWGAGWIWGGFATAASVSAFLIAAVVSINWANKAECQQVSARLTTERDGGQVG